jgi:hypothetical protein
MHRGLTQINMAGVISNIIYYRLANFATRDMSELFRAVFESPHKQNHRADLKHDLFH